MPAPQNGLDAIQYIGDTLDFPTPLHANTQNQARLRVTDFIDDSISRIHATLVTYGFPAEFADGVYADLHARVRAENEPAIQNYTRCPITIAELLLWPTLKLWLQENSSISVAAYAYA